MYIICIGGEEQLTLQTAEYNVKKRNSLAYGWTRRRYTSMKIYRNM